MALRRRSAFLMTCTMLLLVLAFQRREAQLRPLEMRARASRWVLTAAWMVERYHRDHGVFPTCGGGQPPCVRFLGWMSAPYRLEGYQVQVRPVGSSYRIEAIGSAGRWVLERGGPIRWEGSLEELRRPGWLELG